MAELSRPSSDTEKGGIKLPVRVPPTDDEYLGFVYCVKRTLETSHEFEEFMDILEAGSRKE